MSAGIGQLSNFLGSVADIIQGKTLHEEVSIEEVVTTRDSLQVRIAAMREEEGCDVTDKASRDAFLAELREEESSEEIEARRTRYLSIMIDMRAHADAVRNIDGDAIFKVLFS